MNTLKRKRKKQEIKQHREMVYRNALEKLFNGEVPPEYVTERFEKLKQVR